MPTTVPGLKTASGDSERLRRHDRRGRDRHRATSTRFSMGAPINGSGLAVMMGLL
jgi:hypothetical protein